MLHSKFHTLFISAIVLFLAFTTNTTFTHAAETLVMGNCTERITSSTASNGAALFFPATTMSAYTGCEISDIKVGFDTSTEGGMVRLFLAHDINAEPFYTETVDAAKRGWNTFTLTTPYIIDGKPLYVGYAINGAKYVSTCSRFIEGEEWMLKDGSWLHNDKKSSVAIQAIVSGTNIPPNNAKLGIVHMPIYTVTGKPINYTGTFQNLGIESVRNLTFTFIKDGIAVGSETIDGLDVGPREEGYFNINSFAIDKDGEADIQLMITAVNGGMDAIDTDNKSKITHTISRKSYTKRNVLLEFFSTERCTGCPRAHHNIDELFKDATDIVEIGHHAGFYTDQFTIPESSEYEWFYKPGNLHAPALMFDRTCIADTYPDVFTDGVLVISATNTSNAAVMHMECAAIPAIESLNIESKLEGRELTLNVSGQQLLPIATPDSVHLCVYLTEDSIYTTSQAGESSGFYHRFSARRSLTPAWGDNILPEVFSKTYTTNIPEEWDINQMRAVVFVFNRNASDKNDNRILNSCQTKLVSPTTAINDCNLDANGSEKWSMIRTDGRQIGRGENKASLLYTLNKTETGLYIVRRGNKTIKVCNK